MKSERAPYISIGIATYNGADSYLRDSLESAISQTYKDIEIIVSDNCSTDNTESLVRGYNDRRIRYFRQKHNIGMNNNFNFCVEKARGKYFLLLCDDDLIDSDFAESCVQALKGKTDAGVVLTGTRVIDERGSVLKEYYNTLNGAPFADLFIDWFGGSNTALYLCSTLYNTERLQALKGFHSKTYVYQDIYTTATLAAKYGRIDVSDIKASFRKYSTSHGRTIQVDTWIADSLYIIDTICNLCPPERKEELQQKALTSFSKKNIGVPAIFGMYLNGGVPICGFTDNLNTCVHR